MKAIEKAMREYARSRKSIAMWLETARTGEWRSIVEMQKVFSTADLIRGTPYTCFNIGGNAFRLITVVSYARQEIQVYELITHARYNEKYVWRKP